MSLEPVLELLEPLRILDAPSGQKPICIIILQKDLRRLPVWLKRRQDLSVSHVLVADAAPDAKIDLDVLPADLRATAENGLESLPRLQNIDKVFMYMPGWIIGYACMLDPALAREKIYIPASHDAALAHRAPNPDFYKNNAQNLDEACQLLAAREDREVLARAVKAVMTGDPGYLPVAPFPEYHHPLVSLREGDALLDGGLSDMVGAQGIFAEQIGLSGQAHGFEPIPWMAEKAAAQLAKYPQYHVHAKGLADKCGTARFASLRDSSHIMAGEGEGVDCALTTIDAFVQVENLDKVDAIKLDVEGAELAALRGGERIIRSFHPKLIICVYHKPRDLFEIPLYIHQIAPGYNMRMAHSGCGFTDTILYADYGSAGQDVVFH